jgi:type VI secretion system secreted protein Hcp
MRILIRVLVAVILIGAGRCIGEEVYLKIAGIQGEVTQKGREGSVKVLAVNHEIVSPRDPASGLPTGKRQHVPFRCVITHDKTLPLLMQALTQNKTIPTIEVNFYRPTPTGVEELYMKYLLTNVGVSSIRPWMPNTKDATTATFGAQVELALVYEKISWTFTNGGITHEDSWSELR